MQAGPLSNAATQVAASGPFDNRRAGTLQHYQPMTATR